MLASTRGPSTNPACAATMSSAPSDASVATTKPCPAHEPPAKARASTAFMVRPSTCRTFHSR